MDAEQHVLLAVAAGNSRRIIPLTLLGVQEAVDVVQHVQSVVAADKLRPTILLTLLGVQEAADVVQHAQLVVVADKLKPIQSVALTGLRGLPVVPVVKELDHAQHAIEQMREAKLTHLLNPAGSPAGMDAEEYVIHAAGRLLHILQHGETGAAGVHPVQTM